MKLDSLHDLYVEDLKDLYSAEGQLVKALPKMAKAASAPELKAAFQEHLEVTRGQVERLEKIFEVLKERVLLKAVLDAALIGAAQRVEHYEMAGGYGFTFINGPTSR